MGLTSSVRALLESVTLPEPDRRLQYISMSRTSGSADSAPVPRGANSVEMAGRAVTVFVGGRKVVDLWGGVADERRRVRGGLRL
jgi:hypothetical protein